MRRPAADITREYQAQGYTRKEMQMIGVDAPRPGDISVTPLYRDRSVDHIISRLTPGQLEYMQQQFIDARMIDADTTASGEPFYPGVAGAQTMDALKYTLEVANRAGKTWMTIAEEMAEEGRAWTAAKEAEEAAQAEEDARIPIQPYVPETYVEPDMASWRDIATTAIEDEVGRKVQQWELDLLVDQMGADHRENFDREESERRADYTMRAESDMRGDLFEPTYLDAQEPVEAIDYEARMRARFDEMFGKEVEMQRQGEFVRQGTQRLFAGIDNAEAAIRR